jgi:predicted transposase YdaD
MPYVTTAERIGIQKGKQETAKNLLLLEILTDEQIADATGLDLEEIRDLKEKLESANDSISE